MNINPFDLKKADMQVYLTGHCKHRVPYQQHPVCFDKEILHNEKEYKIGFLDIETYGLSFSANQGIMLTYYIKEYHKKKYYCNKIKLKDLRSKHKDKNLMKQFVKDLKQFDRVITYYGSRFDIPYVRTRALKWNLDFPLYKYITHKDVYYIIRNKFKFRYNSLGQACSFFGIDGKNHLKPEIWLDAITGNRKSLGYIYTHNKYDVDILEKLYDKVIGYVMQNYRSI